MHIGVSHNGPQLNMDELDAGLLDFMQYTKVNSRRSRQIFSRGHIKGDFESKSGRQSFRMLIR